MQFQGRLHLANAGLWCCLDVDLYIRLYSVYHKSCKLLKKKNHPWSLYYTAFNLSINDFTWGLRMALRIWRTASWASANLVWASTSCSIWLWWFTWWKLRNCDTGRGLALGVALFTSIRLPSTTAPCRALCADAASSGLLRLTNPNPFDPFSLVTTSASVTVP